MKVIEPYFSVLTPREWRHFLKLRCAPDAHPQMQQIAKLILKLFRERVPVLVEDITY